MRDRSLPQARPARYRTETRSVRKERPTHGDKVRPIGVPLGFAFALGAGLVEAQNRGERIGAAPNRSAQATGRAAQRAGSATGAAADRSLS